MFYHQLNQITMSRPERVSDEIKQTKLKKAQTDALKALVDSLANMEDDNIVKSVKEHCNKKNIRFLGVKAENQMGNRCITVYLQTASYSFKVGRTPKEEPVS